MGVGLAVREANGKEDLSERAFDMRARWLRRQGPRRTGRGEASNYTASLNLKVKVLDFVKAGGPGRVRTCDHSVMSRALYH